MGDGFVSLLSIFVCELRRLVYQIDATSLDFPLHYGVTGSTTIVSTSALKSSSPDMIVRVPVVSGAIGLASWTPGGFLNLFIRPNILPKVGVRQSVAVFKRFGATDTSLLLLVPATYLLIIGPSQSSIVQGWIGISSSHN